MVVVGDEHALVPRRRSRRELAGARGRGELLSSIDERDMYIFHQSLTFIPHLHLARWFYRLWYRRPSE